MSEENRNLLLFFFITILVFIGYPYFFGTEQKNIITNLNNETYVANQTPEISSNKIKSEDNTKKQIIIYPEKKITLESEYITAEFSSHGACLNKVILKKYNKDQKNSENKTSFFGNNTEDYYAITGWQSTTPNIKLPDERTNWKITSNINDKKSKELVLSWDNNCGLLFEKKITIDDKYLITIQDKVTNYQNTLIKLKPITYVKKAIKDNTEDDTSYAYQGPLGYFKNKLEEIKYEDIASKHLMQYEFTDGWYGITDKYWLLAFVPTNDSNNKITYSHAVENNINVYNIKCEDAEIPLYSMTTVSKTNNVFIGAKEINILDMYEKTIGAKHFDLAIDFGWLYLLTKPLLYSLAYLKDFIGNMGLCIILLTLLIKLFLYPFATKSYRSMNRMSLLQPKIKDLQNRYANDKVKLGQEISALYQKEKINPMGGCLPALIQSPILFALYKVFYISIEMRHAEFFGWIHDLSQPDNMFFLNLFGLIPVNLPSFLQIGIWPILMALSMFIQQKITPSTADQNQKNMMMIMPVMFLFIFSRLSSGLVIYWTFSNLFGIIQQYIIMREDKNVVKNGIKA